MIHQPSELPARTQGKRQRRLGPIGAAACGAALAALGMASALADTVHMTGGRQVNGIVLPAEETPELVVIRTSTGKVKINKTKIVKIDIRQEMSEEEKQGDLASDQSDYDRALRLYLQAYSAEPDNKNLETKISAMKNEIKKRDDRKFGQQFDKMDKLVAAGKYQEAVAVGKELSEKVDESSVRERCIEKIAQAYTSEAKNFENTVSYPQAEAAYRKALEANPKWAIAAIGLGALIERYPTRRAEAHDFFKQGIDLALQDPTLIDKDALLGYRFSAAKLQMDMGRFREAANSFWDVVKLDAKEKHTKGLDYIVRCYGSIEKDLFAETPENAAAMAVLEGVAEKKPTEHDAPYILGRIYFSREKYPESKRYLERAIKNLGSTDGQTDTAEAHYMLARSLRKQEQDRESIDHFKKTIDIFPNRYDVICDLGDAYFDLSEYENALESYRSAVGLQPDNYRAYYGAGKTLRRVEKYAEAVVMYETLVKLKSDEPQFFFELGLTYTALQKHDGALKSYTKVLELLQGVNEADPKFRFLLAESYLNLGLTDRALERYNEANEQFDKALVYHPGYGRAFDGKGKTCMALNDLPAAEKNFNEAIKAEPDNPEYQLNLGTLNHIHKKDTKAALVYYMAYYAKGGKDPQVRQWIIECGGTPPE